MTALYVFIPIAVTLFLALPFIWAHRHPEKAKRSMVINVCAFAAVFLICLAIPIGSVIAASPSEKEVASGAPVSMEAELPEAIAEPTETGASGGLDRGLGYLGAALATGLACLGAGIAVAAAAPAAIGAVSEDPKSFGKAMIFVVLGEGVAIYGLLISILIINSL